MQALRMAGTNSTPLEGGWAQPRMCPRPHPCRRLTNTTRWGKGCHWPAAWERCSCRWQGRRRGAPGSSWTGTSRCRRRRGLFWGGGRQGGQAGSRLGGRNNDRWGRGVREGGQGVTAFGTGVLALRIPGGRAEPNACKPSPHPCRRLPSTSRWGKGWRWPAARERCTCRWPGHRCVAPGSSWTGTSRRPQRRGLFGEGQARWAGSRLGGRPPA
jgi:hypothetical protein